MKMDADMSSINASMFQSMAEGEHKIELLLHRMKGTHNKCDLSTARTFANQFRHRLDAVFIRFIENTNFDENPELNLSAVALSSITPANNKVENGEGNNNDDDKKIDYSSGMDDDDADANSNIVWICDSDDEDSVRVATKKDSSIFSRKIQADNQNRNDSRCSKVGRTPPNKTPTRLSIRQRTIKHHHSSCTACKLNQKHNNSPTKKQRNMCEVCKKVYYSLYDVQVHRMSHLMPDTIHCSVCLHIFDRNDQKMKHQSKCKRLRYECYLCRKTLRDRSKCTKHLLWHTKRN